MNKKFFDKYFDGEEFLLFLFAITYILIGICIGLLL